MKISMNGRGRYQDNIFEERLLRTVKYEVVYLQGYGCATEARGELGECFLFYNNHRLHRARCCRTPAEVFYGEPVAKEWSCSDQPVLGSHEGVQ